MFFFSLQPPRYAEYAEYASFSCGRGRSSAILSWRSIPPPCISPGSPQSLLRQGPAVSKKVVVAVVVQLSLVVSPPRLPDRVRLGPRPLKLGRRVSSRGVRRSHTRRCLPKISGTHPSSDSQPLGSSKRRFPATASSWSTDGHEDGTRHWRTSEHPVTGSTAESFLRGPQGIFLGLGARKAACG